MIDESGRVLTVDISIADAAKMQQYRGNGLFPSARKYDPLHIARAVSYIKKNRPALADFITLLKKSTPPNPHLVMDEMCPFFDDKNIVALRSADKKEPYLCYLIAQLRRSPATPPLPFSCNVV